MADEKKIIFHIGLPKTGTTALQQFLNLNAERFEEAGTCYPRSGRWNNQHFFLAAPASDDPQLSEKAWNELRYEVNGAKWNSLLLTSERFCFHPQPEELFRQCAALEGEPYVVLFLRNRAALSASDFRTAIKTWPRVCCSADVYLPCFIETKRAVLNYDLLVERWQGAFGPERVHIVNYDEICQSGNTTSAFCDMLRRLGVAVPQFTEEEMSTRVHETQPDLVLDLLLRTNQFHYGDFPYWKVIRQLFVASETIALDGSLSTVDMQFSEDGVQFLKSVFHEMGKGSQDESIGDSVDRAVSASGRQKKDIASDAERVELQREMLHCLPKPLAVGLQVKSGQSLNQLVEIPVMRNELEHYKALYKRDYAALKMRLDRESFQRQQAAAATQSSSYSTSSSVCEGIRSMLGWARKG